MKNTDKYAIILKVDGDYIFVTNISNKDKSAEWEKGKAPYLMASMIYAKDVAHGLCLNGIPAMAVIVPEYLAETL